MLKGFSLNGEPIRGTNLQRLLAYLEALPFKQLRTTPELVTATGVGRDDAAMRRPETFKRRALVNNQLVWGSLKSITSLKKRMEKEA